METIFDSIYKHCKFEKYCKFEIETCNNLDKKFGGILHNYIYLVLK